MKNYIAYGSNLNITQMKYRCPSAEIVCVGLIEDHRLAFKGSRSGNYLTIEPAKNHTVPVAVWSISDQDEINLDAYEGFPTFYRKETITVKTPGFTESEVTGMVYIMNGCKYGQPSDSYMKTCVEGYNAFGFSLRALRDAVDYSVER